jgi:hypothetical protein
MKHAGADSLLYKPLPRFNELQKLLEGVVETRRAAQSNRPVLPPPPPLG